MENSLFVSVDMDDYMSRLFSSKNLIIVFIAVPIAFSMGIILLQFVPLLDNLIFYYVFLISFTLVVYVLSSYVLKRLTPGEDRGRRHHDKLMNQSSGSFYLRLKEEEKP